MLNEYSMIIHNTAIDILIGFSCDCVDYFANMAVSSGYYPHMWCTVGCG